MSYYFYKPETIKVLRYYVRYQKTSAAIPHHSAHTIKETIYLLPPCTWCYCFQFLFDRPIFQRFSKSVRPGFPKSSLSGIVEARLHI